MTNADLMQAIRELSDRFSSLEKKINKNTTDIETIKEKVEGLDFQMNATDEKVYAVDCRVFEQVTSNKD